MARGALLLGFLLLTGSLPAHPLAAQEAGFRIAVTPKVGWSMHQGNLGEVGQVTDPNVTNASDAFTYGGAVEIQPRGSLYSGRINIGYVPETKIRRDSVVTGGTASILNITVDGVAQMYGASARRGLNVIMFAGAGVKRYQFARGPAAVPQIVGNHTTITGHFGIAILVPVGPAMLALELSDYPSWFDPNDSQITAGGNVQTDIAVELGLRLSTR